MKFANPASRRKALERRFKGVANHWRIKLLELICAEDALTVEQIAEKSGGHLKTISVHLQKLVSSGLVHKRYVGRSVTHTPSPYGLLVVRFMDSLLR